MSELQSISTRDAKRVAAALERWFAAKQRKLPWRMKRGGKAQRAYRTMVAELMLQQTQVARVIEYFNRFIERFPTVHDLAAADEQDVLALWQGLGYYRRARHLHAAATQIVAEFDGVVPSKVDELLTLPGIGRYTAGAIASIAYGRHEPIVDGNVERVVARLLAIDEPVNTAHVKKLIWSIARQLVEHAGDPGAFNQAFMEHGSTVCTPRSPKCEPCVIAKHCLAKRLDRVDAVPVPKKPANQQRMWATTIVIRRRSQLLLVQRPANGLWANMWQAPTLESSSKAPTNARLQQLLREEVGFTPANGSLKKQTQFVHQTSHREIHFEVWTLREFTGRKRIGTWVHVNELDQYPISNAQRRILEGGG